MRKIAIVLLILFCCVAVKCSFGQTLKFTQIEKASGNGSVVITTGTNNVLTYTNALPAALIPTLSAYVPYTGATTSVNLAANSLSVGIIKSATVAVASPSNGWQWYDPTLNAFTWYHSDATGSTYNAVWKNALRSMSVYGPSTASPIYGWSFVTDDASNAGIGFQPNGSFRFGINSNSVVCTPAMRIGSSTAPTKTLDVTGTGAFSQSLTTAGISNTGTLMCTSTSTFMGQIDVDGGSISLTGNRYIGSSNNQFSIRSNNLPRMAFDATGNINMTPSSSVLCSGQFSVSSTSTLTGSVKLGANMIMTNNTIIQGIDAGATTRNLFTWNSSDNILINGRPGVSDIILNPTSGGNGVYVKANGTFGINVATPQASLHVAGNGSVSSTFTVGGGTVLQNTLTVGNTSTLTGGNSGTIATLSDALFTIAFNPINTNLASDATSYYFGNTNYPPQTFAATMGTVALPYNCTLVAWTFNYYIGSTVGTSEACTLYIRSNNTTDTQLSNAITFDSATATGFSASGLSNNFSAGDRINAKLLMGTLVTNPAQVYCGLTLFFVRRL